MDTSTLTSAGIKPRSAILSAATDDLREALHGVVAAAAPFTSREHFTPWVLVQHRFQREIEPLYRISALQDWLPDLANRGRLAATEADLSDLSAAVLFRKAQTLGLSENFGSRHLAAAPEGRTRHWRQFIEALGRLELDAADETRMREAARDVCAMPA
ncbi:biliverdin-producing heme oxygenase [Solimonas sp. SE-A11]|uniref:biliverdin-producing heme oxygenase n=1 Tax=Solimonas sp. SE-A11 TaxID=3054954 RepID=UPI00259CB92D|nr:biliverdin-producing heme oxygenase [Solimonas sp. SE-A11]MDM4771082.1 biliverdin-producing heme oxygenase [Solimonas sp. SE-A11]